jgi:hypothetical protein
VPPVAVVVPPGAVVMPPVTLLPLAVVRHAVVRRAVRRRAARRRCRVPPVAFCVPWWPIGGIGPYQGTVASVPLDVPNGG